MLCDVTFRSPYYVGFDAFIKTPIMCYALGISLMLFSVFFSVYFTLSETSVQTCDRVAVFS